MEGSFFRPPLKGSGFSHRCIIRFVEESDIRVARCHAAEEVAFAGAEDREVSYPSMILREVGEVIVRLNHISGRCFIIIVRQGIRNRSHLFQKTGHRAPSPIPSNGDVHRIRRQIITADMYRIAIGGIDHIGIDIAEVVEVTDETLALFGVGHEMACSRILNEVSFRPWFICGHDIRYFRHVLPEIEIERGPVPSGLKDNGLALSTDGSQEDGITISTTIDSALSEVNVTIRRKVIYLTGGLKLRGRESIT